MNLQIDLNTNLDECGNVIDGNVVNENTVDDKDGKNLEPYTGLVFDTQDDSYSFYLRYAKCMGFGISKKSSRRSKLSGEFIDAKFTCTRYGIKRESSAINQRPCLKVDCKALLYVKRNSCGKWHVLCVLQSLGVFNIPPHYILKRWSKNAESLDSTSSTSNIPKGIQFKKRRFDKLFYQATKLSEEGSLSSGSFNIAYCAVQDALEKCIRVNRSLKEHEVELDGAYKVDKENIDGNLLDDISILDPQISSTKGALKE
ncbi:hypothetical protein AB3S75_028307 [Citrus x aurantiifolia]